MRPFAMERWQSTYENRVAYNLSESGVHPFTLGELLELAGDGDALRHTRLSYGQSNGTDELRARIAALCPGASDANIVVTNGSAEANFVAVWELVHPGDEVVILVPTYMQTYGLAEAFGAHIREVHLHEDRGWQPDPAEIDAAITGRTRLVIVTNPNNPTGAVLAAEARQTLVHAVERSGAWLLADEVYSGAELDGPETASFWGSCPRVVATGSLSKAYGLPGLRVGWLTAPTELADRLWARTDYTTISPGALTDGLATLALRPDVRLRILARTRSILRSTLPRLTAWLDGAGIFRYRPPDAGAICYLRYDLPATSSEIAEWLRREQDVLVVPGDHFGMERYLRIGYGLPARELSDALARVEHGLATVASRGQRWHG